MDLFFQPKICWKAVGRNLTFAIVESGTFLTAPASFISAGDYNPIILAFLCSKVGRYFIYQNSDTTGAGDIMLNIQSLVQFPIPTGEHIELSRLCNKMILSPTDEIQHQMDSIIYKAYNFDREEIHIIENY